MIDNHRVHMPPKVMALGNIQEAINLLTDIYHRDDGATAAIEDLFAAREKLINVLAKGAMNAKVGRY